MWAIQFFTDGRWVNIKTYKTEKRAKKAWLDKYSMVASPDFRLVKYTENNGWQIVANRGENEDEKIK